MSKNDYFDERLHAAYTSKDLREIAKLAEKADTSERGSRALDTLGKAIQKVIAENQTPSESTAKIKKLVKIRKDIGFIVESYSFPLDTISWLRAKDAIIEAKIISASLLILKFNRNEIDQERIMAQLSLIYDVDPKIWEKIKNVFQLYVCLRDGGLRSF